MKKELYRRLDEKSIRCAILAGYVKSAYEHIKFKPLYYLNQWLIKRGEQYMRKSVYAYREHVKREYYKLKEKENEE